MRVFYLKLFLLIFFMGGFIADVFYIVPTKDYGTDIRLFFFIGVWIAIVHIYKWKSTATFKLLLAFLLLLIILFTFYRTSESVERLALWIYLYFFIGIIQQFNEVRRLAKKKKSL